MFKITEISLDTYSSKEIVEMSTVEIRSPNTFDSDAKILPHGLYDERMGPPKIGTNCMSCNLNYFDCPGHFGHIDLKCDIYNPLFFNELLSKVKSICFNCKIIQKSKCSKCHTKLSKVTSNRMNIYRNSKLIYPKEIKYILEEIGIETQPLFLDVIPVVPNRFRPLNYMDGKMFEDPQNLILSRILKCVEAVCEGKSKYVSLTSNDTTVELANMVLSYYDNSNIKYFKGAPPVGIKQLLEKKEGLFRKHIMGKRVNYAARSVISPDPYLKTSEVGIPEIFASKLTFPERVTPFNVERLSKLIIDNKANFLMNNNVLINLGTLSLENKLALVNQLALGSKVVYRHILDNDSVLLNRQPTLHKPSLMSHKVKVLKNEKTIRLHYSNCNSYNADFDGDEMNIHSLQNYMSVSESTLCSTDSNYKVATNGDPIRHLVQDHVVMNAKLSRDGYFLSEWEYKEYVGIHRCFDQGVKKSNFEEIFKGFKVDNSAFNKPAILRPVRIYTGKQVITYCLLINKLNISIKTLGMVFKKGIFISGMLTKKTISSKNGLINQLGEIYGFNVSNEVLSLLSLIVNEMLLRDANTVGFDDIVMTPHGCEMKNKIVSDIKSKVSDFITNIDDIETHTDAQIDNMIKNEVNSEYQRFNNLFGSLIKQLPENNIHMIISTGAKGSLVNLMQISLLLGQQELEGRRVPKMINRKTLPCFKPSNLLISNGFIPESFVDGISKSSYFFHCMAGREGLIDTAVKTARSGYLQRCLVKHMEGLKVEYDKTVRNAGNIVSFAFGDDNIDCCKIVSVLEGNEDVFREKYLREKYNNGLPTADVISIDDLKSWLCEKALVDPGTPVGIIAAQSVGEPSTQMTLNTFHFAGVGSKNMTLGIPRLVEIIMVASKKIKTPFIRISGCNLKEAFERVYLKDVLEELEVSESLFLNRNKKIVINMKCKGKINVKGSLERDFLKRLKSEIKRMTKKDEIIVERAKEANTEVKETSEQDMEDKEEDENNSEEISGEDAIKPSEEPLVEAEDQNGEVDENELDKIYEEKMSQIPEDISEYDDKSKRQKKSADFQCDIKSISEDNFVIELLMIDPDLIIYPLIELVIENIVVKEYNGITDSSYHDGQMHLDGCNLNLLSVLQEDILLGNLDCICNNVMDTDFNCCIDILKSYSNDIHSVKEILGIESARNVIINEIKSVFDVYGIEINIRHLKLVGDYMCKSGDILPFSRNGFKDDSILQRMSFESCFSVLKQSVKNKSYDALLNPSASLTVGNPVLAGTGSFELLYDFEL